jgi:PST family polysaccharide transporter
VPTSPASSTPPVRFVTDTVYAPASDAGGIELTSSRTSGKDGPTSGAGSAGAGRASGADGSSGSDDLGGSAYRGVRWSMVDQAGQQVIRMVVTILLTRWTMPGDVGLFALAYTFTQIAGWVSDLGTGAALVRKPELESKHVRVGLSLGLIAGGVFGLLLVATSGGIASFFNEPRLAPVLVAMAIMFPVRGLAAVPRALLMREMRFKGLAASTLGGLTVSAVISLTVAVRGGGVVALVLWVLLEAIVTGLLQFVFAASHPQFRLMPSLDPKTTKELARFGLAVTGGNLLFYLQANVDNLIVGKRLGAEALGYYGLAYRLMLYPIQRIADVVSNVALPVFARVQGDRPRLLDGYIRGTRAVCLVCFPLSVGLAVTAPTLIPLLLGSTWVPAVPTVQVLSVSGCFIALCRLNGPLYQAVGKPMWDLWFSLGGLIAFTIGFFLGVSGGIEGVAWSYTIVRMGVAAVGLTLAAIQLETTPWRLAKSVSGIALSTALLAALALGASALTTGMPDLLRLVIMAAAGTVGFGIGILTFERTFFLDTVGGLLGRRLQREPETIYSPDDFLIPPRKDSEPVA